MRGVLTLEHRGMPPRSHVMRLGQTYTLGRGREATIRIDDDRVSRKHARITLTPAGLEVEDLASRNGTTLDGQPLQPGERRQIGRRGVVQLGDARVTLELETDPESPRTKRLDNALPDLAQDYEVIGEIGHGATGRVYVARHRRLERTVAVKALKPQFAPGSRERERFLREGKLAARVRSPHVVEVYDVRVCDDRPYIIMELVQGPSAKDRIAQGAVSIEEGLRIGEDIARALAAAADAGIVHRDVKPGNILIDAEGNAKLGDFGIAKDVDQSTVHALTASGDGLGTLAYVSPEQATDARVVDNRTDIYGLGATLFHLVAGRPPFLPTSAKVLLDILDKPAPPLSAYRPDAPEGVCSLVDQMLKKEPADRPQTAHEVAARIAELRLRLGFRRTAGRDKTLDARSASSSDRLASLGERSTSEREVALGFQDLLDEDPPPAS